MMNDKKYVDRAIALAKKSTEPVRCGAVFVDVNGTVIAEAYNTQRPDKRTANHAEMKALAAANQIMGRTLAGVTVYTNCEPCTMCLTALIFARVDRIVFVNRVNDIIPEEYKIDIDCFDFIGKFPSPYPTKLEQFKS